MPSRLLALSILPSARSTLRGIAVAASKEMSKENSGEVLVSATTHDLVAGSDIAFRDHGEHELRGIDGKRRVYAVL